MLVIIGPSASGKTEIVNNLISKYNMKKMVTYTTRSMRPNEVNGIDYHFISKNDFLKKIDEGFFLEYVIYNGNYYGTSISSLSSEKVVIVEASGLKAYIKEAKDKIKIVFVKCDKDIRKKRMIERLDKMDVISKRLENDDNIFNNKIEALADFVIDTGNNDIETETKLVYNFYKPYI